MDDLKPPSHRGRAFAGSLRRVSSAAAWLENASAGAEGFQQLSRAVRFEEGGIAYRNDAVLNVVGSAKLNGCTLSITADRTRLDISES
mgnify:CR=1 FL=1